MNLLQLLNVNALVLFVIISFGDGVGYNVYTLIHFLTTRK